MIKIVGPIKFDMNGCQPEVNIMRGGGGDSGSCARLGKVIGEFRGLHSILLILAAGTTGNYHRPLITRLLISYLTTLNYTLLPLKVD